MADTFPCYLGSMLVFFCGKVQVRINLLEDRLWQRERVCFGAEQLNIEISRFIRG